jgi:hypothetical protein
LGFTPERAKPLRITVSSEGSFIDLFSCSITSFEGNRVGVVGSSDWGFVNAAGKIGKINMMNAKMAAKNGFNTVFLLYDISRLGTGVVYDIARLNKYC